MSEKAKNKPEGAESNSDIPESPAAPTDPSPEDTNITPKTTPQQSSE